MLVFGVTSLIFLRYSRALSTVEPNYRLDSHPFSEFYQILSDWNSDIGQLLQLVERSCHLINKENMLHKVV